VKTEERIRKAVITASDDVTPESLVRRVVSAYLMGYNIIQVRNPEKRLDLKQRYAVKEFVRRKLVGTEILSDVSNELTLQVLLSYPELSVKDALRRMSVIAVSMHRDAIEALSSGNPQLAREVIAMDDEVDRFSLYVVRLLKEAISDRRILPEIGLNTPEECLGYRLIAKSIERVADHAADIAKNGLMLTLSTTSEDVANELRSMSSSALRLFEMAMKSLDEWSYTSADAVLEGIGETRGMEAGALQKIIKYAPAEDVPSLRLIIESILRTAEYGSDIAEAVLNMTIVDEIREE
jgi:phosphate uptake regulator